MTDRDTSWLPVDEKTEGHKSALSRRAVLHGLGCGCALAATGCISKNAATGRNSFTGLYSIEDDIKLGQQEHPKLVAQFGGEYEDRQLQSYVDRIGFKAAEFCEYKFPYKFTIVNSPIVNAFALPGGFVYISRGLLTLASTEAEVASVLAHELGHVNARHSAERISQSQLAQLGIGILGIATGSAAAANAAGQAAGLAIQSYSRDQELEADKLGIRYMAQAGYDPQGSVDFLATLRENSILEAEMRGLSADVVDEYNIQATHPRTIERVNLARQLAAVTTVDQPIVGRDPHLEAINGVLYGDDPDEGLILGNTFVHRVLKFEYTVPDGFTLRNSPTRVVAQHKDRSVIVFDMSRAAEGTALTSYIRDVWAKNARLTSLQTLDINGLEAATAKTQIKSGNTILDLRMIAIRGDGQNIFHLRFITAAGQGDKYNVDFRRTTYSFRRLTPEEANAIRAKRVIVAPVVPGDTIEALSRTMPFDEFNERAFRVLNDMDSGDALPNSGLIKIVAQ